MQIQDLKRWHWLVISIGIGLLLSYVWSNVEWGEQLPTVGGPDFERGLVTKFPGQGHLQNIVVLPPMEGKYKVVCEQLKRTTDPRKMRYRGVAFMAETPFQSSRLNKQFPNVIDYLKAVKAEGAEADFKYAWYREPWAVYTLWTTMSLVLIGIVWPSVVSLMTGGGLGLTREAKEPDYDLSRFGKGARREEPKPATAGAPSHNMDDVRRFDEELEKRLAAGATSGAGLGVSTSGTDQQQTRKLDSGPLEVAAIKKEDENKEYGGEFYPVAKPIHQKKRDE